MSILRKEKRQNEGGKIMKVILQKDVKALGKKGELVEVSEGYAKNYLLKNKLAVIANNENVNIMTGQKKSAEYKKEQEIEHAKKLAKELESLKVVFQAKTGENGKLFGSITAKDIAEKLEKDHKIKLDKKKIVLDDAIKTLGMVNVEVRLYEGIHTKLKVEVKSL